MFHDRKIDPHNNGHRRLKMPFQANLNATEEALLTRVKKQRGVMTHREILVMLLREEEARLDRHKAHD